MIDIVLNESPITHVHEYDAVIVGTNCYQSMRNGFQFEAAHYYPFVEEMNYTTKYGDPDKLGDILECKKEGNPTFILAYISFGFNFKGGDCEYIDYDALAKCLRLLNILYAGRHLATTMIGCSQYDGNGDREKVLTMLNGYMKDTDLTVYDYIQDSHAVLSERYFRLREKEDKWRMRKKKEEQKERKKEKKKQETTQ